MFTSNSNNIFKKIVTDNNLSEFQIRFNKEEGVGILTSEDGRSYLILDSIDYWYDAIQLSYPKTKKCSCKNEWFNVEFEYVPRIGTDDFRNVIIWSTCSQCQKKNKVAEIDIDYSPTEQLIIQPITYCPKPKIIYKTLELNLYLTKADYRKIVRYLANELFKRTYAYVFINNDRSIFEPSNTEIDRLIKDMGTLEEFKFEYKNEKLLDFYLRLIPYHGRNT